MNKFDEIYEMIIEGGDESWLFTAIIENTSDLTSKEIADMLKNDNQIHRDIINKTGLTPWVTYNEDLSFTISFNASAVEVAKKFEGSRVINKTFTLCKKIINKNLKKRFSGKVTLKSLEK